MVRVISVRNAVSTNHFIIIITDMTKRQEQIGNIIYGCQFYLDTVFISSVADGHY